MVEVRWLYLKISAEFAHLIPQDRCWFVNIPFISMATFQFLHWVIFSCLVLYLFGASLLHSLNIRLIVSSLSSHTLLLLFCCVLSLLVLIWLVLMVFFCVALRRDSVSLFRFSHVKFSRERRHFWCLKISRFFFSSHYYFLVIFVLLILVWSVLFLLVMDQCSSALFYIFFESLYRCINVVFKTDTSLSFIFSRHIVCPRPSGFQGPMHAVVCMFSTHPLISTFSILWWLLSAPITTGITVIFVPFYQFSCNSNVFTYLFVFFYF